MSWDDLLIELAEDVVETVDDPAIEPPDISESAGRRAGRKYMMGLALAIALIIFASWLYQVWTAR